jgi:hypothetical protein
MSLQLAATRSCRLATALEDGSIHSIIYTSTTMSESAKIT